MSRGPARSRFRQALRADRARAFGAVGPSGERSRRDWYAFQLLDSEFHCVAAYRLGRYAREVRAESPVAGMLLTALHRIINRVITHIDHVDISPQAQIGPGLLLMHRHGVLVGPIRVGANCVIHQNVTIGQRVAKGDHGVPEIGDNVWIGPGAIITGSIRVGDGVTISAGSVLSKDVPDHCLVAGNPARVVNPDYDNSVLLGFRPEL